MGTTFVHSTSLPPKKCCSARARPNTTGFTHSKCEGFASSVKVISTLSPLEVGYYLLRDVPKWYLTSPEPEYLVECSLFGSTP